MDREDAIAELVDVCERLAEYMTAWLSPEGRRLRDELLAALAAVKREGQR